MEAFKKKSLQMREVVYRTTGYRFDIKGETKYKISHVYAEAQDDFLLLEVCTKIN